MGIQSVENELRIVQTRERQRQRGKERERRVHNMQETLLKAEDKAICSN